MQHTAKPVIIIPAYKPETVLRELVASLSENDYHIIVVNDGSPAHFTPLFEALALFPSVMVVTHALNLGKGQALKTGFNAYLTHFPDHTLGVITADADGQHLVQDIIKIALTLEHHPKTLCLGVRIFDQKVPLRSRLGNQLTRIIFRFFLGQSLQDTQTGLRGIPRDFLPKLLTTNSQGYDFELDMLVLAAKKLPIVEVPIHTVYHNNNRGSHFNPLIDSFKIYFVFVRFLTFSILSGLLDFVAFSFVYMLSGQILLSESAARLFSGSCNFMLNKSLVFQSKRKIMPEILKYALLCAANLICSFALISTLVYMGCSVWVSKLLTLTGLFIANFAIQNGLIFATVKEPALTD